MSSPNLTKSDVQSIRADASFAWLARAFCAGASQVVRVYLFSCECVRIVNPVFVKAYFRQTKIQNLCIPRLVNEDVGRLDVSVNDTLVMSSTQAVRHVCSDSQKDLQFHRVPGNRALQSFPFQILHDGEGFAVLFANVLNGAYVGMIQRGSNLGLTTKSL